jgi:endonuclease I
VDIERKSINLAVFNNYFIIMTLSSIARKMISNALIKDDASITQRLHPFDLLPTKEPAHCEIPSKMAVVCLMDEGSSHFNIKSMEMPNYTSTMAARFARIRAVVLLTWLLLTVSFVIGQIPTGYYTPAAGKAGAALKTALHEIMSNPYEEQTYAFLYTIFERSDTRPDGTIWDMYSTCTWEHGNKRCGNYKYVCDCYNREHSVPASWFNDRAPMYTDAFHLYPTDGRVNGQRGNDPFGECAAGTSLTNGLGKSGNSTFPGYSGRVFEPIDEYKGDFARTLFYFVTRYEDIMTSVSTSQTSFSGNKYPSLNSWSIALFLKWHREDPVSEKEIIRNNVIHEYQKNRNAFIDHPIIAEHIWGNLMGNAWDITAIASPAEILARIHHNINSETILLAHDLGQLTYEVINISGAKVLQGTALGGDQVSVASLQQGIYFFRVNTNELKVVRKFVVH